MLACRNVHCWSSVSLFHPERSREIWVCPSIFLWSMCPIIPWLLHPSFISCLVHPCMRDLGASFDLCFSSWPLHPFILNLVWWIHCSSHAGCILDCLAMLLCCWNGLVPFSFPHLKIPLVKCMKMNHAWCLSQMTWQSPDGTWHHTAVWSADVFFHV